MEESHLSERRGVQDGMQQCSKCSRARGESSGSKESTGTRQDWQLFRRCSFVVDRSPVLNSIQLSEGYVTDYSQDLHFTRETFRGSTLPGQPRDVKGEVTSVTTLSTSCRRERYRSNARKDSRRDQYKEPITTTAIEYIDLLNGMAT